MQFDILRIFLSILIFAIAVAGCGNPPATSSPVTTDPTAETEIGESTPSTVSTSTTLDPCSPAQIEEEVQKVHSHMREFDDAATLASNMPRQQLGDSIAELQRIRREAEDESISDCLGTLKTYQIEHMNAVISTLLAFMKAGNLEAIGNCTNVEPNTEAAAICQTIAFARQRHDEYTLELARLLGLPIVSATAPPANTPAETPTP
jgi:hypothetical protein